MAITYTFDSLKAILISLGYKEIKKLTASKLAILTNENRVSVLENLTKKITGARYDSTPKSDSSAGRVIVGNMTVLAKPASKQGRFSAGVENEDTLVKAINDMAAKGPIRVEFKAPNKSFIVESVVSARSVGADTAGRKKADAVVKDIKGIEYPLSIKKDNAEVWESADSYFGAEAKKIVEKAVSLGLAKLNDQGSFFTLEPNIAVEATTPEKRDVVFGSDIERRGAVITKTFTSQSFKQVDETLVVECSHVITQMSDVKGDKDVYFLIRNDKTRKSIKDYPGLRVLASYKKRINKNVQIVPR